MGFKYPLKAKSRSERTTGADVAPSHRVFPAPQPHVDRRVVSVFTVIGTGAVIPLKPMVRRGRGIANLHLKTSHL